MTSGEVSEQLYRNEMRACKLHWTKDGSMNRPDSGWSFILRKGDCHRLFVYNDHFGTVSLILVVIEVIRSSNC